MYRCWKLLRSSLYEISSSFHVHFQFSNHGNSRGNEWTSHWIVVITRRYFMFDSWSRVWIRLKRECSGRIGSFVDWLRYIVIHASLVSSMFEDHLVFFSNLKFNQDSVWWIGVAKEREVEGDIILSDLGDGIPFRAGTFDGAISISTLQWLCNADESHHNPIKRLYTFFSTLFAALVSISENCDYNKSSCNSLFSSYGTS